MNPYQMVPKKFWHIFFQSHFLYLLHHSGCLALHEVNPNQKKKKAMSGDFALWCKILKMIDLHINFFQRIEDTKVFLLLSLINFLSINFVVVNPCSANIHLFKVNNRNTRTRSEICSKLGIKAPERRHWPRSDVFIVNFYHISHLFLLFYCWLWTSKC